MRFCREICFDAIYAFLCGEFLLQCREKMTYIRYVHSIFIFHIIWKYPLKDRFYPLCFGQRFYNSVTIHGFGTPGIWELQDSQTPGFSVQQQKHHKKKRRRKTILYEPSHQCIPSSNIWSRGVDRTCCRQCTFRNPPCIIFI